MVVPLLFATVDEASTESATEGGTYVLKNRAAQPCCSKALFAGVSSKAGIGLKLGLFLL